MVDDSRQTTKVYLEANDVPANVTKDDDVTPALYHVQYERPPYPLTRLFFDPKHLDGLFTIGTPSSDALNDWKHEAYAYRENVPIEIDAVTKWGMNGDKLRWKLELELRRIVENNPLGSLCTRKLTRSTPQIRPLGDTWKMHTVNYNLAYKRANPDYTSDVALSYGAGWEYDCDHDAGGIEGAWTLTVGGSTGNYSLSTWKGMLCVSITVNVNDIYMSHAGNLGLTTTLYPRMRVKFLTTGNATARVDVDGTTVMAETASGGTWKVVDFSIAAEATADVVKLYTCDGVGAVYWDWVMIYAGNFTFPNAVTINDKLASRNQRVPISNRITSVPQNLGGEDDAIEMVCDLDVETSATAGVAGCWKRTGDYRAGDVFRDIVQGHSTEGPWQWLVYGVDKLRVTLDEPEFDYGGENKVRLTFREYSDSNMALHVWYQRFGLDT